MLEWPGLTGSHATVPLYWFWIWAPKKRGLVTSRTAKCTATNEPAWQAPKTFGDSPGTTLTCSSTVAPVQLGRKRAGGTRWDPEGPGSGCGYPAKGGPRFFFTFPGELIHETQKQTKIG